MAFAEGEDSADLFASSVYSLQREGLIALESAGPADYMKEKLPWADDSGALLRPTVDGVALFLWAHGLGTLPVTRFLDPTLPIGPFEEVKIQPGSRLVADAQREWEQMTDESAPG
jgi:hypothetical protein